jgi:hypothetical protein
MTTEAAVTDYITREITRVQGIIEDMHAAQKHGRWIVPGTLTYWQNVLSYLQKSS